MISAKVWLKEYQGGSQDVRRVVPQPTTRQRTPATAEPPVPVPAIRDQPTVSGHTMNHPPPHPSTITRGGTVMTRDQATGRRRKRCPTVGVEEGLTAPSGLQTQYQSIQPEGRPTAKRKCVRPARGEPAKLQQPGIRNYLSQILNQCPASGDHGDQGGGDSR